MPYPSGKEPHPAEYPVAPLPDDTLLGTYSISKCLSGEPARHPRETGSSYVYLAQDTRSGETVVLKEWVPAGSLRTDGTNWEPADADMWSSFAFSVGQHLEDCRSAKLYDHPSIVHVSAIMRACNTVFIVMPYVGPCHLQEALASCKISREGQLRTVLRSLLGALQTIHAAGRVHGDIKPTNIVANPSGIPILIDTDSGKKTGHAHTSYTPGFSAPEQHPRTEAAVAPACDIYALGATMHYMVYGTDIHQAHGKAIVPCSDAFLAGIAKACATDPAKRWPSARAWAEALGDFDDEPMDMHLSADNPFVRLFGSVPGPLSDIPRTIGFVPSTIVFGSMPSTDSGNNDTIVIEEDDSDDFRAGDTIVVEEDDSDDFRAGDTIVIGEDDPDDFRAGDTIVIEEDDSDDFRTGDTIVIEEDDSDDFRAGDTIVIGEEGEEREALPGMRCTGVDEADWPKPEAACKPLPLPQSLYGYRLFSIARLELNAIVYQAVDPRGAACELVEFTPSLLCERNPGSRCIEAMPGFDQAMLRYLSALADWGEISPDRGMPWHSGMNCKNPALFFANGTVYHCREAVGDNFLLQLSEVLPTAPAAPARYAEALGAVVDAVEKMHDKGVAHGALDFYSVYRNRSGVAFSVPSLGLLSAREDFRMVELPYPDCECLHNCYKGEAKDVFMVADMFHYLLTGRFARRYGRMEILFNPPLADNAALCQHFGRPWLATIDRALRSGAYSAAKWRSELQALR